MTTDNFLPYGRQSIDSFDVTTVSRVLQSPFITRGPKVEEFEEAVAEYCGAQFAVAFCNGSCAMSAAYQAIDAGVQDRVVTTPNTFVGTFSGAAIRGAQPLFVDIDRNTGNVDMELFIENVNAEKSRGRTIAVPVHFAGIACDMRKLAGAIQGADTVVIEDAAHAIGSSYPSGERVGSCTYSDMTMFSFHPVKNITCGEGGLITTNDQSLYERLVKLRNSGMERAPEKMQAPALPWMYEVQEYALNFHMTDMQAALGLSQLGKLDFFADQRRERVARYREQLADVEGVRLFTPEADPLSCYHLFVVQVDFAQSGMSREDLMDVLKQQGIGTQVHYIPCYRHPVLREPVDVTPYFPEMEEYYEQALTLPLYVDLKLEEVDRVCSALKAALKPKVPAKARRR